MGLGSGIRKNPIPDPRSRSQKGTGSRIRIRNTDFSDVFFLSQVDQVETTSSSVEEKEKSPSPSPRSPVGSTSGVVASAPRSLFAGGMEDSDSDDDEDNNSQLVEKLRRLNQEQSAAQAALITQTLLR
jgi:hypothetical protein